MERCKNCNAVFERPSSTGRPQVHCSAECRVSYSRRTRGMRLEKCLECGGVISQPTVGAPRKYCTIKCNTKANNRRIRRRRLPLRDSKPQARICLYCKKLFMPKRRDSRYCYNSWCVQYAYRERKRNGESSKWVLHSVDCGQCGKTFEAIHPAARWCSDYCRNKHTMRVMSRNRGGAMTVPYTDRQIFERDQWRCHLCRQPVDPDLPRTDLCGATIDHILPISLGGTDEPANVATAHWHCNHKKRAQLMEQLASLGKDFA